MLVSFLMGKEATLSNCGKALKTLTPSAYWKRWRGRANCPGYGKSSRYESKELGEMGDLQPSPKAFLSRELWMLFTGQMAVGKRGKKSFCLRYGRSPSESWGNKFTLTMKNEL
jgi:hypothetical protein